ncbi:MAG: alpha-galactosidase [Verrucomicrobia bacterium]|nr:MAG: alpha-galactosidase [Verrucomicrobiota bacterium]
MRPTFYLAWCLGLGWWAGLGNASESVPLGSLDLSLMRQGWGRPRIDRAVTGKPLAIGGRRFDHGVGTHARSTLWVRLDGRAERFQAMVGVDDAAGNRRASVRFRLYADDEKLFDSGRMTLGDPPKPVDVDLSGRRSLLLLVTDAGDGIDFDHANWAEARFIMAEGRPVAVKAPEEPRVILTPKPGPAPRINGPTVSGCRPGHPFLYRIPTTGERPMRFSVEGLPPGLQLDAENGILSGVAPPRGDHVLTLRAANRHGEARRRFTIRSGDLLALTPPMGWNHWYAHYNRITDAMVREAADLMVRTGMADAGYQYVNIDDCWMRARPGGNPANRDREGSFRDASGRLLPNRYFPDMKALTDHIHALGLKAGIYTSPGPYTCAGFAGSYQHEEQDAATFAEWGFDFLKYDWCSYGRVATGEGRERLMKPYRLMGDILRRQPRDIVFNLCQYGMGNVWEWGARVGGHSWRTGGDLGFELDNLFEVAKRNARLRQWHGPGHWNDPDYIQIGYVGNARQTGEPRPCPLSPNEQYAFMSLWCLLAAPLFYSGDMTRLDEFTLNILCNPELIEVDQDPLGRCGRLVEGPGETFLLVKELADGSRAIGLFNADEVPATVRADWRALGLGPKQRVRDLWRQQELGVFADGYTARLPRRSGMVLRVWEAR